MDNVLAENENANTAQRKHASNGTYTRAYQAAEAPVHSDYGTCV